MHNRLLLGYIKTNTISVLQYVWDLRVVCSAKLEGERQDQILSLISISKEKEAMFSEKTP